MGVFLDKPKKEKEFESGEGNGVKYAHCSMQGWRLEMEDAYSIRLELTPCFNSCSFFAVFDGHAGDFASKYSSEHLIETILDLWNTTVSQNKGDTSVISNLTIQDDVEKFRQNVIEGFLKIDSDMRCLPKFKSGEEKSGTTAVAAFLTPSRLMFANCGDSRGLICCNNEIKFVTHDHKPYNEEEQRRIENAGGSVMIQRVNGALAVSRAIGDYDYKNSPELPPTKQLVSPEPDFTIVDRSSDDEFLILACDGIWDVMTNEEVISYIRSRLMVYSDLNQICEELLETCLAKGSKDNMSVIIITFPACPKPTPQAIEKENLLDSKIKAKIEELVQQHAENTTLNLVFDEMQAMELEDLPPGGGIQAKHYLIEKTLDAIIPERPNEQATGAAGMLGSLPLSMLRQLTHDAENPSSDTT